MKFQNIEFIVEDPTLVEAFPIVPAKKMVPDWYKNLEKYAEPIHTYEHEKSWPTIKNCMPVQDYITSGYIIPNCYEVDIKNLREADGSLSSRTNLSEPNYIGGHPHRQCPVKTKGQDRHFFKFQQPWKIVTPPGYSCFIYQPFYFFEERFTILPGIVDTDKHDLTVSLPAINNMPEDHLYTIDPGTPLVVVHPFKRESWQHKLTVDKIFQKTKLKYWLRNAYQKVHHVKKIWK